MTPELIPLVFTPDNEPYLGRKSLFVLDQLINAALQANARTAPRSHTRPLTDRQRMACQLIPQALSIALSIRELIRQGYLFGGHVLVRPLVERATILLYLHEFPTEIERWNRGWHQGDAPGLAKMFDAIQVKGNRDPMTPGRNLTAAMNSLLHAKPDSAAWNLMPMGDSGMTHAASKLLNRPDLCDDLCDNVIPWLAVIPAMMATYFPDEPAA